MYGVKPGKPGAKQGEPDCQIQHCILTATGDGGEGHDTDNGENELRQDAGGDIDHDARSGNRPRDAPAMQQECAQELAADARDRQQGVDRIRNPADPEQLPDRHALFPGQKHVPGKHIEYENCEPEQADQ